MKIMHTADWHIGKIFNQVHLTADQEYIIGQMFEHIEREKPDVLVIAGDLYDRSVPPVEAVELLDRTFSRLLLEYKLPLLVIAGNHDSPDRVGFAGSILQAQGLHIAGRLKLSLQPVVLSDEWGEVEFYLLPYAPPGVVRELLPEAEVNDHDSAFAALLESLPEKEAGRRRVLVAHGYVRGAEDLEESESEKPLAIGGTDYVQASRLAAFDYAALGHLHRPQQAGGERIRYSGSLLKYSFSETQQPKSLTLVELDAHGALKITLLPLKPLRDVRKIKGTLAALLAPEVYEAQNREDYLHVTLTDDGEVVEPMARLRAVYPNILALEREQRQKEEAGGNAAKLHLRSEEELFADFYQIAAGRELDAARRGLVKNAVAQALAGKEQE